MNIKQLTPTVPVHVGTPVWFLPNANPLNNPLPATVVSVTDNMVAVLMIILPDGGWDRRLAVYPLESKFLSDANGKPNPNALRNGAWCYHPDFIPKVPELAAVSTEVKQDVSGKQDTERNGGGDDSTPGGSTEGDSAGGATGGEGGEGSGVEGRSYSQEDVEAVLRLFKQHGDVERLYRQVRGRKLDRKEVDEILATNEVGK